MLLTQETMTPVGAVMVILMPRAPAECFCHKDDVSGIALPDTSFFLCGKICCVGVEADALASRRRTRQDQQPQHRQWYSAERLIAGQLLRKLTWCRVNSLRQRSFLGHNTSALCRHSRCARAALHRPLVLGYAKKLVLVTAQTLPEYGALSLLKC